MASKTARRSSPQITRSGTPEQIVAAAASSPIRRITPLNGGRHCYLANPLTGKNLHLATDSDEFVATISELSSLGLGDRLRAELTELAGTYPDTEWPGILDRLGDALAGTGAATDDQGED